MERFLLKEFAKTPTIPTGVYGSEIQGNATLSEDYTEIQSGTAWEQGIGGATSNALEQPALNDDQGVYKVLCKAIKNGQVSGIPLWINTETYYKGSICLVVSNDIPYLYFSLTDNNINNNPLSDTVNWQQLSLNGGYDLFDFKFCDHELDNIAWLRADTFSWQSGTTYNIAYNHLLNDIQGKTVQTETIGNTTISYYLADDGHKIVDVANISQVESVYSETGIAWYYVIDTANTQFKLPRTKFGFVGLRDNVGNYVNETLPNITGSAVIAGGQNQMQVYNTTGCFTYTEYGNSTTTISGQSGQANKGLTLNANLSNPVYQDNAPVQQKATEMYLYFYVGNFTREAIEETAGLNSELFNGKVDLDGSNATFTNLPDTTKQTMFSNLSETTKEILYKNIFSLIQTTDSTKVGYYTAWWNGNNYTLPAGGTWLVWSIHQQTYNNFSSVGKVDSTGCGLFAGGSTITYGNAYTIGWAIRIQ